MHVCPYLLPSLHWVSLNCFQAYPEPLLLLCMHQSQKRGCFQTCGRKIKSSCLRYFQKLATKNPHGKWRPLSTFADSLENSVLKQGTLDPTKYTCISLGITTTLNLFKPILLPFSTATPNSESSWSADRYKLQFQQEILDKQ